MTSPLLYTATVGGFEPDSSRWAFSTPSGWPFSTPSGWPDSTVHVARWSSSSGRAAAAVRAATLASWTPRVDVHIGTAAWVLPGARWELLQHFAPGRWRVAVSCCLDMCGLILNARMCGLILDVGHVWIMCGLCSMMDMCGL